MEMTRGRTALLPLACAALVFLVLLGGCGSKQETQPVGTTGTASGDAAQLAACQANLRTIDAAIAQYKAANGKDPKSLQDLVPTYLRSIPQEPMGGTYSISGGKAVCSKGHTY
jgi:hypothetical protein